MFVCACLYVYVRMCVCVTRCNLNSLTREKECNIWLIITQRFAIMQDIDSISWTLAQFPGIRFP